MKPNELMIGDWVYRIDFNTPVPVKIIGIEVVNYDKMEYVVDVLNKNGYNVQLYLNEIKPIPITPEILEKNGFEKVLDEDGTECYRYYNSAADGYIKISLYNGGDGDWSIEIINYEKFDNNEIVYNNNFIFLKVHQLQHALKDCGINKEIEL